tara:strand:- start:408 stop:1109 length:702 start_codon:yes stop_codon:yes gene_type:complete
MINEKHITCFIPCRSGSERVPKKNINSIGNFQFGLLEIKLKQALSCKKIDKVLLSTNDDEILSYAYRLKHAHDNLIVDERGEELCSSTTSTDELIEYIPSIIPDGDILWTHVTSPFLTADSYNSMIEKYYEVIGDYDSLMTVSRIQNFLWNEKNPINYIREIEKWPRTQTLNAVYEITSGAFICNLQNYIENSDRIGKKPFLYESNKFESIDVDWPEDFDYVSSLISANICDV